MALNLKGLQAVKNKVGEKAAESPAIKAPTIKAAPAENATETDAQLKRQYEQKASNRDSKPVSFRMSKKNLERLEKYQAEKGLIGDRTPILKMAIEEFLEKRGY